jgi:hypothetical protein
VARARLRLANADASASENGFILPPSFYPGNWDVICQGTLKMVFYFTAVSSIVIIQNVSTLIFPQVVKKSSTSTVRP